jgi:hypothetical protein
LRSKPSRCLDLGISNSILQISLRVLIEVHNGFGHESKLLYISKIDTLASRFDMALILCIQSPFFVEFFKFIPIETLSFQLGSIM